MENETKIVLQNRKLNKKIHFLFRSFLTGSVGVDFKGTEKQSRSLK